MENATLSIDETVAVIGFDGIFDVCKTESVAFLVRFCRYEVLIGRKLTLIVVRRIDYERSAVLDDLKYDVLLVTLQNGFDGIVENVRDCCR